MENKELLHKLERQTQLAESLRREVDKLKRKLQLHTRQFSHNTCTQVEELNCLLTWTEERLDNERLMRLQAVNQQKETEKQLKHERSLMYKHMKEEQRLRQELEKVMQPCNESSSNLHVPSELQDGKRKKKTKKELEKDVEELTRSHNNIKLKMSDEQQKNKVLEAELREQKVKNEDLLQKLQQLSDRNLKFETELQAEKSKLRLLEQEVQGERKLHAERVTKDLELIEKLKAERVAKELELEEKLKAEREAAQQKMEEAMKLLKKDDLEKSKVFKEQLEEKTSFCLQLTAKVEAEEEKNQVLQRELAKLKKDLEVEICELSVMQEESLPNPHSLKVQEDIPESPEETRKPLWKQVRSALTPSMYRRWKKQRKERRKDKESLSMTLTPEHTNVDTHKHN